MKLATFCFAAFAGCLWRLSVYYDSGCFACRKFLATKLQSVATFANTASDLSMELNPFFKGSFSTATSQVEFTCPNGPDECLEEKVHACVLQKTSNPSRALKMISCISYLRDQNSGISTLDALSSCNRIVTQGMENFDFCINGAEGDGILLGYAQKAQHLPKLGDAAVQVNESVLPLEQASEFFESPLQFICNLTGLCGQNTTASLNNGCTLTDTAPCNSALRQFFASLKANIQAQRTAISQQFTDLETYISDSERIFIQKSESGLARVSSTSGRGSVVADVMGVKGKLEDLKASLTLVMNVLAALVAETEALTSGDSLETPSLPEQIKESVSGLGDIYPKLFSLLKIADLIQKKTTGDKAATEKTAGDKGLLTPTQPDLSTLPGEVLISTPPAPGTQGLVSLPQVDLGQSPSTQPPSAEEDAKAKALLSAQQLFGE